MDMFEDELVLVAAPSQRREPSPTFDDSDEDGSDGGPAPRSQRAASPTFDESDESDESDTCRTGRCLSGTCQGGERVEREGGAPSQQPSQGSRARSPTFDSDDGSPPRAEVASLFQTGAGRSVRLSAASLQRGQQLMAADNGAAGGRAAQTAGGAVKGPCASASGGALRAGRGVGQPAQSAATRGTAVKRPASPSFDDDAEPQSDPTVTLFARPASGAARRVAPSSATQDRPVQGVQRLPVAASAASGAAAGDIVAPTPAGKPQTKQRRRTRVRGPSARLGLTAARHMFLSRRLQQRPQTLAAATLYAASTQVQCGQSDALASSVLRNDGECKRVLRNCGRSASIFGNTAHDLLSDLVQDGADPKLIDEPWVLNHSRWIIWKLAGYSLHLPALKKQLPDAPCDFSLSSFREQLRYRYDIEKGQGKRSVLRKIMDGDTGPSRPMVLCVASVLTSTENGQTSTRLEVTDGWWPAIALLDDALTMRCKAGQIKPGDKLWVVGARPPAKESKTELKPSSGQLKLRFHANGTRKAHRHSKLGWQRMSPRSFALPIRSLYLDGGSVCCMDIVVQRVYPTLYREQTREGTVIFRNADAEAQASKQYQSSLDSRREEISAKVMRKHQDVSVNNRSSIDSGRRPNSRGLDTLDDDELYATVTRSYDPDALARSLTDHQRNRLYRAMEQRRNNIATEIQVALESDASCSAREVTQLFRMHVSDATVMLSSNLSSSQSACVVTVWGCHDDTKRMFTEGRRLRLFNVHAANRSSGVSSFNFRQDSQVEVVDDAKQRNRCQTFIPRKTLLCSQLSGCGVGAQVDFTGVLLSLSPAATDRARTKGCLFVMDHTKHIVCVQMWRFSDAKQIGAPNDNPSRLVLTTVEVRDAFYGGRDSWSGGTHLVYSTEDTAVVFRSVRQSNRLVSGRASNLEVHSGLVRWLASPTTSVAIELIESQLSTHLEIEQPKFVTSLGLGTQDDMDSLVIERGTVELSGCLLANRCRADALVTAEARLSAQSQEGRRLNLASNEAAKSVVIGEAHICIFESSNGNNVRSAVADHGALMTMLAAAGVSTEPATSLLVSGATRAEDVCVDRMIRRLVRDGICDCVGQNAATSYLPVSTIANPQHLFGPVGTPQLRGQVALHRAQTLQRHVSMNASITTMVAVSASVLESAIVVSAAQMLECLARLAAMPEEVCVLPFLPDEWAWVCSQFTADLVTRPMKVRLQRATWTHDGSQCWVCGSNAIEVLAPENLSTTIKQLAQQGMGRS